MNFNDDLSPAASSSPNLLNSAAPPPSRLSNPNTTSSGRRSPFPTRNPSTVHELFIASVANEGGKESPLDVKVIEKWKKMRDRGFHTFWRTHPKTFLRRLKRGVPQAYRWRVWWTIISERSSEPLPDITDWNPFDSSYSELIRIDIPRTFPDLLCFTSEAQEMLSRILNAYANYRPRIGYCQGMNFVAGFILLVAELKENEAFQVFTVLMEDYELQGFFGENFPLLLKYIDAFDELSVKEIPDLRRHFGREGVQCPMYMHQWLLTVFVTALPLRTVVVLWDYFLAEGLIVLLPLCISLLKVLSRFLLNLKFEQIVSFLKSLRYSGQCDEGKIGRLLIRQAEKTNITDEFRQQLTGLDLEALTQAVNLSVTSDAYKRSSVSREEIPSLLFSSNNWLNTVYPFTQYFKEIGKVAEELLVPPDTQQEEDESVNSERSERPERSSRELKSLSCSSAAPPASSISHSLSMVSSVSQLRPARHYQFKPLAELRENTGRMDSPSAGNQSPSLLDGTYSSQPQRSNIHQQDDGLT